MKRKIINSLLIAILLMSLFTITGCGNNKTDSSNNESNVSNNESKEISEGFKFIYDINKISDEWWNSVNEEWNIEDYYVRTNKEIYDLGWEGRIGNTTGKLKIRPVGFTENIKIGYKSSNSGKDYYSLTVKDNNFLIPKRIRPISENSDEMEFYVLGNNLEFYNIELSVDDNPKGIELTEGSWKTVSYEDNEKHSYAYINSYYPINSDYCLQITYPSKSSNSNTEIEVKDLKELADKVTSLISLEKMQDQSYMKYATFKVNQDDIKLDDNTTVLMSSMKMTDWNSGATGANKQKDTIIFTCNSRNNSVEILECNKNEDFDSVSSSLLNQSYLGLKEYKYMNRDIYIIYGTDKYPFKGKYVGILFEIDGTIYEVTSLAEGIDPTQSDVDSWIKNMCEEVISFK